MFILSELTAGQNMTETVDLVTLNKRTGHVLMQLWSNFSFLSSVAVLNGLTDQFTQYFISMYWKILFYSNQ